MITRFLKLAALLLLSAAPMLARAADTDCIENGGKTQCSPVWGREWTATWCPTGIWNFNNTAIYCMANGGTWNGTTQSCSGAMGSGLSESQLQGAFENYMAQWYVPSCGAAGQTGSTGFYSTNNCGSAAGPVYINGVESAHGRMISYAGKSQDTQGVCRDWQDAVVIAANRAVTCDMGLKERGGGGGSKECPAAPPCGDGCGQVGNPINVSMGSKSQIETDYASRGNGTLSFVRRYYSGGFFDLAPRTPVNSDYWRHNYSSKLLAYTGNAYVMAAVLRPEGVVRFFNLSGVEIQNNDGAAYRLQKLLDGGGALTGWKLTASDSTVEMYDAAGKLTSITTRDGFVTTLAYDTNGRLETVADAYGRTLTLTYNTDGDLATMTDPAGRLYQYGYDSQKRLTSVTYPDTKTRTYLYEDATWKFALTGIVDERNTRISTYSYDGTGRATTTELAGSRNKYDVTWGTASSTSLTATATDGFGAVHTYTFAKIGGTHKMTQHANNQVGTVTRTFDANGNPDTVTDARNFVTKYVYDATRNLETSRTEAFGNALARTITTTWHTVHRLPATITEPSGVSGVNLVTEFTYDTAGNLQKKKMTAGAKVREWNYTHNSRGQVLTIDGPRTDVSDVTTITYYADNDSCVGCRGQVYTVTNPLGHVTTYNSYNADSRPTQITDANGVVTTLAYKARGWLESKTVGGETTTYDYDSAGNLTKVTNPDSSWVGYQYDADNRFGIPPLSRTPRVGANMAQEVLHGEAGPHGGVQA